MARKLSLYLSMSLLLSLLSAGPAGAATMQGVLVNGTTGAPGHADKIEVLDVTKGEQPIASIENVQGAFTIADLPDAAPAHFSLRILSGENEFTQLIPSFDEPFDVLVFEETDSLEDIRLARHHAVFVRGPEHVQVTEFLEFENRTDPPRIIRASANPMRLRVDHDVHGEITAAVVSTGNTLEIPVTPTDEPGIVALDAGLQPGNTRVVIMYLVHEENLDLRWETTSLFPTDERRILVNPPDIGVQAEGFVPTQSEFEGYAAWAGLPATTGMPWIVQLEGGSTVSAQGEGESGEGQAEAAGFTDVVSRPNRLTPSRNLILGGLAGLLLFGTLAALAGSRQPQMAQDGPDPIDQRVSSIADRYISGEISREEYEKEAARLIRKSGGKPARQA